jgi:hypothetical protein
MSGWSRIAIVLSVLWAVGAPVKMLWDVGTENQETFQRCLRFAYSDGLSTEYSERAAQRCLADAHEADLRYNALLKNTWTDDQGMWAAVIGGPIATLWVVGGLVIGTVRWIGQGFSSARRGLSNGLS